MARFYVHDIPAAGGTAELPHDEAHHLVKVLRLGPGEIVHVFDGRGAEWRARVAAVGKDAATVSLLDRVPVKTPALAISVVQSILKGQSMDDVVRDCTMVGVVSIHPVITARTTVRHPLTAHAPERWRRIALSSAKQCGAARLPEIAEVTRFNQWLEARSKATETFILLEPGAQVPAMTTARQLASRETPGQVTLLVGPEGGWTAEERDRSIAAGCKPLTLGRMTLRAEAVPAIAAAILLAIWD